MTRKLTMLFAAAAVLGAVAAATTVFAEETTTAPPQPPQTEGTMSDHNGMMNMMGQMGPDHMKQITRMVDNCNRMMESMNNAPAGPDRERAPGTHG